MFFEKFNIICIGINYIQNYDDEFSKYFKLDRSQAYLLIWNIRSYNCMVNL